MAYKNKQDIYADFYWKAVNQRDIQESPFPGDKWKVEIELVVELSGESFDAFTDRLYESQKFLEDYAELMYFDDQKDCVHCLLVTTKERKEGMLVQSEGYPYAMHAAYVPDCGALELADISVLKEWEMTAPEDMPEQMSESGQKIRNAKFHFRITDMAGLKECPIEREAEPFQIVRRFCLPEWKFRAFVSDLAGRNPWLNRLNPKALYYEAGESRKCVAVTTDRSREAVLVDTQGYDYARICAYVPDYHRLELSGVPVTYYNGIKAVEGKEPVIDTAVFYRGANTLNGLDGRNPHSHEDSFEVEKQIVLSDTDYMEFVQNMRQDYEFLFSNHRSMYYEPDRQCWHCLFVTGEHTAGGILVDSEGYSHAEYSALIPDKGRLDLSRVPTESYLPGEPTGKQNQNQHPGESRGNKKNTERQEER